jgi:hypothetical protein
MLPQPAMRSNNRSLEKDVAVSLLANRETKISSSFLGIARKIAMPDFA